MYGFRRLSDVLLVDVFRKLSSLVQLYHFIIYKISIGIAMLSYGKLGHGP